MPKQRKSRSSQRTTVPSTTAQSNGRANSADVVQTVKMTQYAQMPTETLRLLLSQRRLVQSGPRQQLIARLQANDSQDSTSPPTGPATMPDQQLASMIASIVEQKLATLNSASNSPLASFSQPLSNIYQAFRTSHQIPLSQMFAMADNNRFPPLWISRCPPCSKTGTPEDAAFLHTNYRVPSIASHLSNSCIAATRALLYPSHPRLSSWDRPMARRLCHLLVRTPLLLPIPEGGPLRLSATDT